MFLYNLIYIFKERSSADYADLADYLRASSFIVKFEV